jgi:hypothetical protein
MDSEVGRRMDGVVASIRRDLEIRVRKQEAFPSKKEVVSEKLQPVNITIHHAANVNLGSQIGTINAALTSISEQGESHKEIARALKDLTDAVLQNNQIQEAQKREVLEVIEDIAKQAEAKPELRSLGKLKAMVAGLHTLVGASSDLSTLWVKYSPAIKHFFNI